MTSRQLLWLGMTALVGAAVAQAPLPLGRAIFNDKHLNTGKYVAQGEHTMNELKRIIDSDGWRLEIDDFITGVVVESKFLPKYNRTAIRSTVTTTKVSALDVFEEAAYHPQDVTKYNHDTDFFNVIKVIDKHNRVIHTQITPRGGFDIPSRDSVSLQTWDYDGKNFFFAYSSTDYPHKKEDGVIRVVTHPSGIKTTPVKPKGIKMRSLINIDAKPPKGIQQEIVDLITRYNQITYYEEFFDYIISKRVNQKKKRSGKAAGL